MDIKDLKFVRLTRAENARLIPKYLIEQDKNKDFTTERFFKIAPYLIADPQNIMGVLVDDNNHVKGFLWIIINLLTEQMCLGVVSVDQEYQNCKGDIGKYILGILRAIPEEYTIKKWIVAMNIKLKDTILTSTNCKRAMKRLHGWREAKQTLMEIFIKEK